MTAVAEPSGERDTISVAEIAARLGCSERTVYDMLNDGVIPAVRTGGKGSRYLIFRRAYNAWIDSHVAAEAS